MKRLQIFRPGKHQSVDGRSIDFTETQLQASATAYDPKVHEAPIVVGHPKGSAPAYGWIDKLAFAEGALDAEPIQVDPAFADLVKAGRYKKVSASFYEPDCPNNPKPGVYYLRHLAFLGAQPPSLKGLKDVEFADNEKGVVEFSDMGAMNVASLMRGLRDWILAKFGQEEADKALPPWNVDNVFFDAVREPGIADDTSSFSEQEHTMKPEELKQREEELAAREKVIATKEASFAERDTKLTVREREARKQAHLEFAGDLVKAGKLLPVHKDGLIAFMESLPEGGTIEFGEGDKKQTPAPLAWLKTFLAAQPKVVEFNERGGAAGGDADLTNDPTTIAVKAADFMESERKAGRSVSSAEAVARVTASAQK